MKFTLQNDATLNLVNACSDSEVRIGDRVVRTSCILTADRIEPDWAPREIASLAPEHLDAVLALDPEVILLGTGARQRFPDARVLRSALERGVAVEVMDTRAACRTYNLLVQEGRRVAAALIVGG